MSTVFFGSVYTVSTAIQVIGNLVLLKYFALIGASTTVFLYTNALYASLVIGAILFYGVGVEAGQERKKYSVVKLAIIVVAVGCVYVPLGVFLAFLLRSSLFKFSQVGSTETILWLLVFAAAIGAYFLNGYQALYLGLLLLSILVFVVAGHGVVGLPCAEDFSWTLFKRASMRSSMDLFLMVPPIVLNLFSFKQLDADEYLVFQMCVASLGFGGVVTNLIERKGFDNNGGGEGSLSLASPFFLGCVVIAVLASLVIAWYYGVVAYALLIVGSSALGTIFGFLLTRFRFVAGADACLRITALWCLLFALLIVVLLSVPIMSVPTILSAMLIFTAAKSWILHRYTQNCDE